MDWTKEAQKYIDTHWRVEGKLAEFMASFASEVERINSCKEWKVDNSEASESRQRVLEQALVTAAVPLEAILLAVDWELSPTVMTAVKEGVEAIRSALAQGEPARTEEK